MPRKEYPPLSPEQLAWLRGWSCAQVATLAKVLRGLEQLGYNAAHPTYRRAYAAMLELKSLTNSAALPSTYLWTPPPWRGSAPPLTIEQRGWLRVVAEDAARDLEHVTEYFDKAGSPDATLSRAVADAANRLRAISIHLHYMECAGAAGSGTRAEPAADASLDNGAGI